MAAKQSLKDSPSVFESVSKPQQKRSSPESGSREIVSLSRDRAHIRRDLIPCDDLGPFITYCKCRVPQDTAWLFPS